MFDAENRLIWSSGGDEYIYDGGGNRVVKCTSSSQNNSCPTGSAGTLYWWGSSGNVLGESGLSGRNLEEYIFFDGARIARRDVATNAVHYYFADHLGSATAVTNASGTSVDESLDYYPYGAVAPTSADTVSQNYKFNGKERDSESGLDNFGARYNASNIGRFMSPDPENAGAINGDPQSWNAYSYVLNNPVNLTDPSGRVFCRPANSVEQKNGLYLVCDLTDTEYTNSTKAQQQAYAQAGYQHYDCSCDTQGDKAAWAERNGNGCNDYVGDALIFLGVLAAVR